MMTPGHFITCKQENDRVKAMGGKLRKIARDIREGARDRQEMTPTEVGVLIGIQHCLREIDQIFSDQVLTHRPTCDHPKGAPAECPFNKEMNGISKTCSCCDKCRGECFDAV